MIAFLYQGLFPYINEVIYEKWKNEWNEKDDKLK